MIAISNRQREYILEEERNLEDKTKQTKFFIKPLSARQYAVISDMMKISAGNKSIENSGSYVLETIKSGLCGWENVVDENGNELNFNKKDIESNIDFLPISVRYELSTAIFELSMMKETDKKN